MLDLLSIIGIGMIFIGFISIFVVIPRKSLHPEVGLLQLRYFFYASSFLMISGLLLIILGLFTQQT